MYKRQLKKGMDICPGGSDGEQWVPEDKKLGKELPVEQRVPALTESVTSAVFGYISAGLFERHKLIMATQLTMGVLRQQGKLDAELFDWLLRAPRSEGMDNPLPEWLGEANWEMVNSIREFEQYACLLYTSPSPRD